MQDEESKTKVKIFISIFILLVIINYFYEAHEKSVEAAITKEKLAAEQKANEKAKAESALAIQREKNKKALQVNENKEKEYAEIIKNNLNKNCNFWVGQYTFTKKPEDKTERDNACKLVGRYFQ